MFEEIVGSSEPLKKVVSRIAKVARAGDSPPIKPFPARVYPCELRSDSTLPHFIASELSGHEKGAFTGATQRRLGRFELADGGTIFLDEWAISHPRPKSRS